MDERDIGLRTPTTPHPPTIYISTVKVPSRQAGYIYRGRRNDRRKQNERPESFHGIKVIPTSSGHRLFFSPSQKPKGKEQGYYCFRLDVGGCGWISQLLLLLLLGGTVSRHIPNTRGPASAPSESGGGWKWEWKLERKPIPRLNLSILCPIQSTPLPAADTQQKRLWQWQTKRSYSQGRRRRTYIQFGTSATEQSREHQGRARG